MPMAESLISIMGVRPTETILDFGCARGYLVKALRKLGRNAYGCDVSEWAISNCDPDVKGCLYTEMFSFVQYDHVFSKDVLEHVDDLNEIVPRLFSIAQKALLFIVPLAECEGCKYIYPNDEKDSTHIHRKTLEGWRAIISQYADGFAVFTSTDLHQLKPIIKDFPGSAGFIYCKKI